jgi:hypothetical protein
VIAVVSAAPKSGATTIARLLAAELASRADGAAVVTCSGPMRGGPPVRAAARLATALRTAVDIRPAGRICLADPDDPETLVKAARYLAPVVLDVPPDGSAAAVAHLADRVAIVAPAAGEPALAGAVRLILGGDPVTVANRIAEAGAWEGRADALIPDSRIAARAAQLGTRPLGPLGAAIADLANALEGPR